jgi:hypothetical protein
MEIADVTKPRSDDAAAEVQLGTLRIRLAISDLEHRVNVDGATIGLVEYGRTMRELRKARVVVNRASDTLDELMSGGHTGLD